MDIVCRILTLLLLWLLPFYEVVAEKKVSVSEVVFDSPVEDVQWMGSDMRTVLVRTLQGRLYRSTDAGRVWSEITSQLKRKNEKSSSQTKVEFLLVSPVDKSVVLTIGRHHSHFISEDAGGTFRQIAPGMSIHNLIFHPTRRDWALMSSWTSACTASNAAHNEPCRHDLYFSSDLGRTWAIIESYVVQYNWGDPQLDMADAVLFTHYGRQRRGASQPRHGGWSDEVSFSIASNPRSKAIRIVKGGNKFLSNNGYLFVAKLKDKQKQTVELLVSTDGGVSFTPAKLPIQLEERSYTVLDASENSVMLHVNHGHDINSGIAVGNVYISDASGIRYSLSLPKNVRTSTGECEFDRVQSLEGVYIANFRDDSPNSSLDNKNTPPEKEAAADMTDDEWLSEDWEEEEDFFDNAMDTSNGKRKKGRQEVRVRTVISFDKGGVWSYLKPPRIDSRGQKISCADAYVRSDKNVSDSIPITHLEGETKGEDGCWLHLHGITNFHRYAPFYSVPNAVGLIMGTGNVGPALSYDADDINTYLSRDGGLTWIEAHKGAYIYEFGDHGGLIVMANDVKKTNQVVFSWNEGHSWYDFDLGDDLLTVDNIVIEPNSTGVEFLLYGTRGTAGVLYHLDFATLGQPPCKGAWAADSVSSDYETWTATDGRTGDSCILGKSTVYTRRKQTSECFNGHGFERPKDVKICTCTERDYECEFGFTRAIDSFACKPEDPNLDFEGCTTGGLFYADAYRKVPGDVCEGGWVPEKVPVICPAHSPLSPRAKYTLLAAMGIMITLAILTYLTNDPRYQRFVSPALDGMATARYAVLGGAARFLDAFDGSTSSKKRKTSTIDSPADVLDVASSNFFSNNKKDEDILEAPPLLDFSLPGNSAPILRGVETAREAVPRLQPPRRDPQSNNEGDQPPTREFEML